MDCIEHERGIRPTTLPSSDDFNRNDRAQLYAAGILHMLRDLKGLPSKLSVFIYDNLLEETDISSA